MALMPLRVRRGVGLLAVAGAGGGVAVRTDPAPAGAERDGGGQPLDGASLPALCARVSIARSTSPSRWQLAASGFFRNCRAGLGVGGGRARRWVVWWGAASVPPEKSDGVCVRRARVWMDLVTSCEREG